MEENSEFDEDGKIEGYGFYRKSDTEFLGMLFILKDGSRMFVENKNKNSIDLEDKSNGE